MKRIFTILIVFCFAHSWGQSLYNYQTLRSRGPIPSDISASSYSKYQSDIEIITKEEKRFERRSKDKFLLQSNYYNDMILRSGKVIFGDTVTNYINKVADIVLADHPELRKQVRFYTLKSPVVNAYSMDNGIILISTGLIAKLDNEMQLAFIIGHEVVHYMKKHAINQFVETEKMRSGKGNYRKLSFDDKIFAGLSYSREDEFMADRESFLQFMLKTSYSLENLISVFDILNYHHLPYADIEFDENYIKPLYHQFKNDYWLDSITPPQPAQTEDEVDIYSTHPNVSERKKAIYSITEEQFTENENSALFLVSEEEFYNVRNICRFENVNLYITSNLLGEAFYYIYLLHHDFQNNYFLDKSLAYVLYAIAIYRNSNQIYDAITAYRKTSGYGQQIYNFFRKINKQEMNCIALNKSWQLSKKYPNDKFFTNINKCLVEELVYEHEIPLSHFATTIPEVSDTSETTKETGKTAAEKSRESYTYTLLEIIDDPELPEMFDFFQKKKINDQEEYVQSRSRKKKKPEPSIGTDTLMVFEPSFHVVDITKKKDNYRLIDSEQKEYNFTRMMIQKAEMNDLNLQIFDSRVIDEENGMQYNDYEATKDWIIQLFLHDAETNMLNWHQEEMDQVNRNNNTKYLYFPYISTLKDKRGVNPTVMAILILSAWPAIPFYLLSSLFPYYDTIYLGAVINTEEGSIEKLSIVNFRMKANDSWFHAILYDDFKKIKQKK